MMIRFLPAVATAALLAGCASTPAPPSPIEVTRFHDGSLLAAARGTVFVEGAPGNALSEREAAPYEAAVASQLGRLGYVESSRTGAALVAQVTVERYRLDADGDRRGPVSVGMGGSTGSYGSGFGVGVGINLGGGKSRERIGTDLAVMLRDKDTGRAVWEGRAQFSVGVEGDLAEPTNQADVIAEALFRNFPGGNGETVQIEVNE